MSHVLHNRHPVVSRSDAGSDTLYTVRSGSKWFERNPRQLTLCECSDDGTAHYERDTVVVVYCQICEFRNIPLSAIEYEHDIQSRSYASLLQTMRQVYGDAFTEHSPVTVIGYRYE